MVFCIFCESNLIENTKPEHILLDAFGVIKTNRLVIYSNCNERFGVTIDSDLAQSTINLRNLFQLPSGSGDLPPTLTRVRAGTDVLNIKGDGSMELVGKPFTVEEISEGKFNIHLTINSVDGI